ncbi:hypothetical protein [Congregibacter sp.]|uniref:hypothetical protein n=1 Tax=Congregibacter sp. TaxID=2744308 RepID=UPI00385D6D46
MAIEQLSGIAEILGAVATIAGLLFLSIQVRDNTKVTKTSTLASMLDDARDRTAGQLCSDPEVSDIVARGVSSIDMLDQKEQLRFTFFVMETVLHMQNVMQLHEAKLLSKIDYLAWLDWTGAILRTPGARAIWPPVSSVITPNIASVLKAHLSENPDTPMLLDLMPVFDRREHAGVPC